MFVKNRSSFATLLCVNPSPGNSAGLHNDFALVDCRSRKARKRLLNSRAEPLRPGETLWFLLFVTRLSPPFRRHSIGPDCCEWHAYLVHECRDRRKSTLRPIVRSASDIADGCRDTAGDVVDKGRHRLLRYPRPADRQSAFAPMMSHEGRHHAEHISELGRDQTCCAATPDERRPVLPQCGCRATAGLVDGAARAARACAICLAGEQPRTAAAVGVQRADILP